MPGSTPISVPSMQPMKAYSRLIGVNATPKPVARWDSNSMFRFPGSGGEEAGPHRELQAQQLDEGEVAADGEDRREDEDLFQLELVARLRRDECQSVDCHDEAHRRH